MNRVSNPFVQNLIIPAVRYITKITPQAMLDDEIYGFEVDTVRSTRLYITKELREFVFSLSIYARDMLLAMQYFAIEDKDYLILSWDKYLALHNGKYSRRRYDDTIRELIKHNILDRKDVDKGEYWYNPRVLSTGDRTKMFPENTMIISTKHYTPKKITT